VQSIFRDLVSPGRDCAELHSAIKKFRPLVGRPGVHRRLSAGAARVDSAIGSYTSSYQQDGRELVIKRRTEGKRGILPPDGSTPSSRG
jgi:hypothetical protein